MNLRRGRRFGYLDSWDGRLVLAVCGGTIIIQRIVQEGEIESMLLLSEISAWFADRLALTETLLALTIADDGCLADKAESIPGCAAGCDLVVVIDLGIC